MVWCRLSLFAWADLADWFFLEKNTASWLTVLTDNLKRRPFSISIVVRNPDSIQLPPETESVGIDEEM
jgi:hypothetical protein